MNLTNSQEEYLKTIYILKKTINEIRVTDISTKMNKTKASVNNAINTLKQSGLLAYEPYGKIELTPEGEREAIRIIEANDIVKLFLTDVLEINPEIAYNEAKKIKTILSNESLNKLARYTHKTLGLSSLECGYDISKVECIKCSKKSN